MADSFGAGPSYGNWGSDFAHSGASRPMDSLKGNMGPVFTRPPLESVAQTGGRVETGAEAPGPAWDECFRAPMATPTRGTKNY